MRETDLTNDELTQKFRNAAQQAFDDADFVTLPEAHRLVEKRLSKAQDVPSTEDGDYDESSATGGGILYTWDELREALPEDLYEAVRAHAKDETDRDRYLGKMGDDLLVRYAEKIDRDVHLQDTALESVAENLETPLLDAIIYDSGGF